MSSLHTLGRWTGDRARLSPEKIAVEDRAGALDYAQLDARSERLAAALLAGGYRAGERIATITANSADQVVLFFACAKSGMVLVPLSWRLSERELREQLELADPALLLVEDEFTAMASAVAREGLPMTALGPDGVEAGVPAPTTLSHDDGPKHPHDDDPLLMIFTSGTLGRAKAAVLSHANCFWTNLSLSRTAPLAEDDVVLSVLPQFHVGGWNIQPLLAWWVGATVILERSFAPERVLETIERRRVTAMMGVPSNYLFLADHPAFPATDLSSLRQAIVGGAAMPERLLRRWHDRGVALSQGYGLTEASPNVLCLAAGDAEQQRGSVGKPYAWVDVAIADADGDGILAGPARGELLVRGPGVFAGYFRDPEQTAAVLRGGWLHSGDLAERDSDGYYRIIDRIKDVFISGGENVAPAEVESVIHDHPAVADAAVVGIPDDRWGEIGIAYVVLRPGESVTGEELLAHCARGLAGFKVPREVRIVRSIPRSSADKVLRRRLWPEGTR